MKHNQHGCPTFPRWSQHLLTLDPLLLLCRFVSRSAFEKAGHATANKWHCSIKVRDVAGIAHG